MRGLFATIISNGEWGGIFPLCGGLSGVIPPLPSENLCGRPRCEFSR